MANYNGAAYLADAVRSVESQSLSELEIIISDDCSTDNSVDIVTRLQASDPRIRLLRSDRNGGPAAARNRAFETVKGQWVAIMDSDDLIHPKRLATLIELADRDGADIIADDLLEFDSDYSRPSRRLLRGEWGHAPFWVDIIDYVRLDQIYAAGPALGYLKPLIRSSILKAATARYDETLRIAEDFNLVLRLLHLGKTMRVYPFPLYYYRKHSNSISHRLNKEVLKALKAAELRFLAQISCEEPRLVSAIAARIKSIDAALAYETLLAALKAKKWSKALAIVLTQPRAAALLRLPIRDRLRRLSVVRQSSEWLLSPDMETPFKEDRRQTSHAPTKLQQ
jgi:succinoglycan biosynthesis protein ExoO